MAKPLVIGIVAGEVSGDNLGAGLIAQLRSRLPDAVFVGIGGPKMAQAGMEIWYPVEELSVMGLEVLRKLFSILRIRREIVKRMKDRGVDMFIGIDAPDFNLAVEDRLHAFGVKTVHYVSPSVWAWRQGRVKTIRRAADHVLCLLPFEKKFYDQHDVPATFVGHTMADQIPMESDVSAARASLGLEAEGRYLALLPGSRTGEVKALSPVFLETCALLAGKFPELQILVPLVNPRLKEMFMAVAAGSGVEDRIRAFDGRAREIMAASDAVLLASGTATLEALLVGRPMVVAYRVSKLAEFIARRMLKVDVVSLPNLLIDSKPVGEFLQDDCNAAKLCQALAALLEADNRQLLEQFAAVHRQLSRNADVTAAEACISVLNR
ncbi:MAG: lipid-A-disaccharide synthase [Succinivibrionaceae bacterium]|nr:lipid-A-disaccharide synthase [Succinivibrionaceae bacterium]